MDNRAALTRLHYEIIRGVIESGGCPSNVELANRMSAPLIEVEELLRSLSGIHGVVLHPRVSRPWVVHPFSLTPTINWVEAEGRKLVGSMRMVRFGCRNSGRRRSSRSYQIRR